MDNREYSNRLNELRKEYADSIRKVAEAISDDYELIMVAGEKSLAYRSEVDTLISQTDWGTGMFPTEIQVNAGAVALMRDDPEAEKGTYGFEDYQAMSRAVLLAAKHI